MRTTWDVAVVPGALVHADGSPSPTLERRVRAAVRMVHDGRARSVLISGRGGGPRTEAEVGAELALALGLSEGQIEREERANRTAENALFCAPLLKGRRAVVVTDRWHAPRTRLWFRRYVGPVDVIGIPGPTRSFVRQLPRELGKLTLQLFESD